MDNCVYIGNKPFMNYVTAVVMQFTQGHDEIKIKARGKYTGRAIDVAEISKKKFVLQFGVYTKSVIIDSTEMPGRKDDGKPILVSDIEITLARK